VHGQTSEQTLPAGALGGMEGTLVDGRFEDEQTQTSETGTSRIRTLIEEQVAEDEAVT
jgi:hypothetical protein